MKYDLRTLAFLLPAHQDVVTHSKSKTILHLKSDVFLQGIIMSAGQEVERRAGSEVGTAKKDAVPYCQRLLNAEFRRRSDDRGQEQEEQEKGGRSREEQKEKGHEEEEDYEL